MKVTCRIISFIFNRPYSQFRIVSSGFWCRQEHCTCLSLIYAYRMNLKQS